MAFTNCESLANVCSILGRVISRATEAPDDVAVVDTRSRLTYAQLELESAQLATRLRNLGAGPERCVGLLVERSVNFVVSALAVLRTGAAYVPIDPSTPEDRAAFVLTDAGAVALVVQPRKIEGVPQGTWAIIDIDDFTWTGKAELDDIEVDPQSLAYIIYTSGSTGRPKGVEITHANLCNLIDWHVAAFEVTSEDRASQVAGLGFDAAVWELWPYLTVGASVHVADEATRRSADALRDWIVSQEITIGFVPTILASQLVATSWPENTRLRCMLTGGDVLHRRPKPGLPFALVNNYGPTECTVVATSGIVSPEGTQNGTPSIGRPIANANALILDEALREVPLGAAGELCLAGALVGRGYRNPSEVNAKAFVTYAPASGQPFHMYRTGDRVRRLGNGEIEFLGRVDDQLKIRGYRVEPAEIVSRLNQCAGIESSAVIALHDESCAEPSLVAYLVPARGANLTASALRAALAAQLPDYMLPSLFVAIPTLPLSANGKLDKSALPRPSSSSALPEGTETTASGTQNDVQGQISALVASLVRQPSIGAEENFFMAGGHSMLGVQLVARIRDSFGVKLTLRQLFTAPTVAALSAEVTRLTKGA
jgi:amino acid adenylation domain-containing protein